VSLPTLAVFASLQAMTQVLSGVRAGEDFAAMAERGLLASMKTVGDLMSQSGPKS
jgi:hypothetical protein